MLRWTSRSSTAATFICFNRCSIRLPPGRSRLAKSRRRCGRCSAGIAVFGCCSTRRILLLDGSPRVLPSYPEDLSAAAERSLIRLGVRSRTNVRVTAIDAESVTLQTPHGEERLETRTVLWAAGVAPSEFGGVLERCAGAQLDRQGRVLVGRDLTIAGHREI